ncbi:MAG: diacylglycerol kinase family protein [Candidatus Magasanikbacteria bacterium]|nr:diacylglycerol kinase family protein [Candidatus Magasanikbacteria bacterium]
MFKWRQLIKSFRYAFKGLRLIFKEEQSFRIQVAAAVGALILMAVFSLRNWEKVALILAISFVLVLELINSIFERLADMMKPRFSFYVEAVKDAMAAAVFLASLAAVAIGLIIFLPYFKN